MCDPLTILGAALTVASTAITLGQQTYQIVTGIQDAPDDIRRLAIDLQGLYHVLGLLSHALSAQNQRSRPESLPVHMITNIQELVEKCIDVFKEISKAVQPFIDNNSKAFRNFTKRFRWEMTKEGNIATMQRTLSDYKLTLELAISSLNFINSSQTIDMVAHLQKDFAKLRRQIDSRDIEERAQKAQTPQQNLSKAENIDQKTYSEPMRRFLARTASVISTTSTSTRVTDSIFSDEMSDVTSITEYTEVTETVAIASKPKDTDYVDYPAEISPKVPEIRLVDVEGPERSLNATFEIERSNDTFGKEGTPEKSTTWKRFKNRMKRNSSSPNLVSVPESELPVSAIPVSERALSPKKSFQVLGRPDDMRRPEQNIEQKPSGENAETASRRPTPIGSELTKSLSVPSVLLQEHGNDPKPSDRVAHRAVTAPIGTLSSLSLQNKPYGIELSRYSSPDNQADIDSASISKQSDRDALLSSLRRGASKSTVMAENAKSSSATDLQSLCKDCSKPIETNRYYRIRSHKWHVSCLRCNSCKVPLQSDSSTVFLVKDDFLVCNSCAYNCQSCDRRVEDHGANDEGLIGSYDQIQLRTQSPGQLSCPGLFFCHDCHKSIKNMRYARTRQGIFCLACHPQTMSEFERERREREREETRVVPLLVG